MAGKWEDFCGTLEEFEGEDVDATLYGLEDNNTFEFIVVPDSFTVDEYIDECEDIREATITLDFDVEVSVTITNNDEIQSINNEFRHIDAPTDVLSFPMYEFEIPGKFDEKALALEPGSVILGDIVVSVDKITEQAEEFGHSFETELSYLVIHSTLHLLGYDHMEESDKRLMRAQEEIIRKM